MAYNRLLLHPGDTSPSPPLSQQASPRTERIVVAVTGDFAHLDYRDWYPTFDMLQAKFRTVRVKAIPMTKLNIPMRYIPR